jgi:hypothetical protein
MAEKEIMHFRDWRLSERHRSWGDLPMMDTDWMTWEYDRRVVVGVCDYKHWSAGLQDHQRSLTADILRSAAGDRYAAWIACYNVDSFEFRVTALNDLARIAFGGRRVFSERDYVAALYRLRGMTAPKSVLDRCNPTRYALVDLDDNFGVRTDEAANEIVSEVEVAN